MSEGVPRDRSAEERLVVCHRFVPKAVSDDEDLHGAVHVWSRTVAGRLQAAGAEVLAHAGATVIATFDAAELTDAIEVGLDLLDEADEAGFSVALGIALGIVRRDDGASPYGAALERAQILAGRAPPGEIVLDAEARARSRGLLLFARQVPCGHGLKGSVVDRSHPRRDASALAMKRLGEPPLAAVTRTLMPALEAALSAPAPRPAVVLRGPPGAGAIELIEEARASAGRARLFVLAGTPSAAVPLGSLRALITTYDLVESAVPAHRPILELVMEGVLPSSERVIEALSATLPEPSWIFVAPLAEVDPASLVVVAGLAAVRPDLVLLARYGLDLPVPPELAALGVVELVLPALRTSDAKSVAEAVLGEGADPEVARRVAVLGGETPLGVLEAARTLVACGEVVHDGERFAVRPGEGRTSKRQSAISLELLIAERADMLDDDSRKTLEAITTLAEPILVAELEAVLELDALSARKVERALARLDEDGWIERASARGQSAVRCANVYVRHLLEANLHPARRAELHRFAYGALENRRDGPMGDAELGLHLVHSGREVAGADRLLAAAHAALDAGHERAAARLSHLARRADPSRAAEAEPLSAGELELPEPPAAPSIAPPALAPVDLSESTGGLDLSEQIADAIRDRDAERLEQVARRAVLEGLEMAEVARLRALADLLRGDVGSAARGLVRARSLRPTGPIGRRALLTEAMVALRAGAATTSLRLALRALADARDGADARGESVALFVMAASHRALGRDADAERLERRAQV